MNKDCHNVLGCEWMPLGLSRFFLIGGMVSFAVVAWVIFLWHAVALRLLLLLGHVAAMRWLLLLWLISALLHSACALGFCRSGAFFDRAALCGGKAWNGLGEIFH